MVAVEGRWTYLGNRIDPAVTCLHSIAQSEALHVGELDLGACFGLEGFCAAGDQQRGVENVEDMHGVAWLPIGKSRR